MGNAVNNGENITYTGNCDVIRTSKGFSWREFSGDGNDDWVYVL